MLIIDMINPFDFEGGREARERAEPIALVIEGLRSQADLSDVPTIYVNDNFGRWHSEKSKIVEHVQPSIADGRIDPRDQDSSSSSRSSRASTRPTSAYCCPSLGCVG